MFYSLETVGGNLAMCAELAKAGVEFTLTTDHDVCALWMLPYFAGLAVREGLDEQAAFRAITLNGAKVCGIEDRVGSIKVGKDADIVVTGEGRIDFQTAMGKAPIGVAKLAKKHGKKVIAFAGCVTEDAEECNAHGIDAFFPIVRRSLGNPVLPVGIIGMSMKR